MRKFQILILVFHFYLAACTHSPTEKNSDSSSSFSPSSSNFPSNSRSIEHFGKDRFESAVAQAFLEIEENQIRKPSQQDLTPPPSIDVNAEKVANFANLRRMSPAKFQVFVFPKITSLNIKSSSFSDPLLGPPQVFEVTLVAESPCNAFISKGLFGQAHPSGVFPRELGESKERHCAIVEITDLAVKKLPRNHLKFGDIVSQRIFIDDKYQAYGQDLLLVDSSKSYETRRLIWSGGKPLSSGLSLFPIDLPTEKQFLLTRQRGSLNLNQEGLDFMGVRQIQRKFLRSFFVSTCNGKIINYRDNLGLVNRVGWCEEAPWPMFINNSRFLAITQPLKSN